MLTRRFKSARRALDLPLSEIADFLQNRDVGTIEQKLTQQKAAVTQKMAELSRIERKIDHRLAQLHDAKAAKLDEIEILASPACRLVWMEDALHIQDFLDMQTPIRRLEQSQQEAVVFLGKVGVGISKAHLLQSQFSQYDCIFLVLDQEDRFGGQTQVLPETLLARIRFRGSHPQAPEAYRRLLSYIAANNLEITDFSREITLIDYGLTSNPGKFVTEIGVPVRQNQF